MTDVSILHVPSEMIMELALGVDPPATVANKYGYAGLKDLVRLQNTPGFNDAVLRERQRLTDEGYTWAVKSRMMLESLIEKQFKDALASGVWRPEDQLKLSALLMDMTGTRKPPQALTPGAGGPAFTINITIPEGARGPTNVKELISGQTTQSKTMVLDMPQKKPALPPVAKMFPLTDDLGGPDVELL
jgi:hypothetical protein